MLFRSVLKVNTKYDAKAQDEIKRMLQEVRLFAAINNPHIIRYNHSWIEITDYKPELVKVEPEHCEEPEEASIDLDSPFIEFDESSTKNEESTSVENSTIRKEEEAITKISLFIQMELCKETLEEYIGRRKLPLSTKEYNKTFEITKQQRKDLLMIQNI